MLKITLFNKVISFQKVFVGCNCLDLVEQEWKVEEEV